MKQFGCIIMIMLSILHMSLPIFETLKKILLWPECHRKIDIIQARVFCLLTIKRLGIIRFLTQKPQIVLDGLKKVMVKNLFFINFSATIRILGIG